MNVIYIEIVLNLILYISTVGYMKTFRGQNFFNFSIASVIMVFNYFAIKSVLVEWDINTFIFIVTSLSIVLFYFFKIFFADKDKKSTSNKLSHKIEKDTTKVLQGKFEGNANYNKRVSKRLFLVGQAIMKSYDANSHIMELELNFDKDIASMLTDINPNARIELNNSDAKLLFENQDSRGFYISTQIIDNSLYIKKVLLLLEDREYMILHNIAKIGSLMVEDTSNLKRFTHKEAVEYAKNLRLGGYSDWRLPTKDELQTIYQNRSRLKNITTSWYWSATKEGYFSSSFWVVNFANGDDNWSTDTNIIYVRCVRQ